MTAPAIFKQADLDRIFRSAKKHDVRVKIEIAPNGKMTITQIIESTNDDEGISGWEDA